jgi:hypothetical protein
MAEIRLNSSGILTVSGKLEAAPVTQHVAVDQNAKPARFASTGYHPLIAGHT